MAKSYLNDPGLNALIQQLSNKIKSHTSGSITDTNGVLDNPNNFATILAIVDYVKNISGKEDVTTIVAPVNATDATLPITTLTCEVGKYYRIDVPIETLSVTLPAMTDLTTVRTVVIYLTAGTNPAITINSDIPIYYYKTFKLLPGKTYEVNALFNGSVWVIDNRGEISDNPFPYDAEIEYLEGRGTQYINSEIIPNDKTKVEVVIYSSNTTDSFYLFGARDLSGTMLFMQAGSANGYKITPTINGKTIADTNWNRHQDGASKYHIILETNNGVCNYQIENLTLNKNFSVENINYSLLGDNISTQLLFLAVRSDQINSGNNRIYYIKITKNDTLVRNMIPVRVGQVGYMYDKVSGQLFGNSGTGAFILGPDK